MTSEIFPEKKAYWKEYNNVNDEKSRCTLAKWQDLWFKEVVRDKHHYLANTNEPRFYSSVSEQIEENPSVGDIFDTTLFIFLIAIILASYIYAICIRRKHFFVANEIPIVTYHYRITKPKKRHSIRRRSDFNLATEFHRKSVKNLESSSAMSGDEGNNISGHPDILRRGSLFMAGGIVLASERYIKTEEEDPSFFCGPCCRRKTMSEKKNKSSVKIRKNKVAPKDYDNPSSSGKSTSSN